MRRTSRSLVAFAVASLLNSGPGYASHDDIPNPPPRTTSRKLLALPNLSRERVTVSGLSSGAYFAHQFHIAYSKLVVGAGLIAGGPYRCVESIQNPYWALWGIRLDPFSAATVACTHYLGDRYWGLRPDAPKATDSLNLIRQAWNERRIDDPSNMRSHRVWLFHGKKDEIVASTVEDVLKQV